MTKNTVPINAFFRSLGLDAIPAFSILALIILSTLPLGLPVHARIGGLLPLVGISYWSLVHPSAMKMPLVFILGLVADCLLFAPLGLHAFVFVTSQAVLRTQKRFLVGQGFWMVWAAFALVVAGAYVMQWLLYSLFTAASLSFFKPLYGAALAWALVPFLAGVLNLLHRVMDLFDEPVL